MYFTQYPSKRTKSQISSSEDFDISALSGSLEQSMRIPSYDYDSGFTPRVRGFMRGLVSTLTIAKSQSICDVHDKPITPRQYKTDTNETLNKIMLRKMGIDSESDSECENKAKLNSLISIMVSTIMCLAAGCPIPRSNIQATKIFITTIVNENGQSPRNVKGLLKVLKNYDGPYEGGDLQKQDRSSRTSSLIESSAQDAESSVKNDSVSSDRTKKLLAPRMKSRLPSLSPVKRRPQ